MSKENKFTPGPWKVDGGVVKGDLFIWASGEYFGGHGLARVFKDGAKRHSGTVEANARLIAAAPEMLAVLRMLLNNFEATGGKSVMEICFIEQAKHAIAKALGEA